MQKDEIIKLINTYWKFDNDQDTTSTWHDKQDLINEIEQLSLPDVVVPKGTLCDVCGSENTITVSHKGENCDWCNPL